MNVELDVVRMNPGVDPTLHVWGWEIPVYLFLGGLAAGLMVIGGLMDLSRKKAWETRLSMWGALSAIAALSVGMLALLLDLSHKAYVPRFYLAFRPTAPMSWGAWILLLAYPALGLWLLDSVSHDRWQRLVERFGLLRLAGGLRRFAAAHRDGVRVATALIGAGVGTYTGILLSSLLARPLWTSGLLGPLFLASGISGAAAFYMLLRAGEQSFRALLVWDVGALAVETLLVGLFLLEKATGTAAERAAAGALLAGPYTGAFFGLVVLGGLMVPLLLEGLELRHKGRAAVAAPLLVLAGGFALRAVLVAAGQATGFAG